MKTQIRQGVFETNSSSVHSLTTFTKSDFTDWIEGRKKFCPHTEKLVDNDIADSENMELVKQNHNNYWYEPGLFIDTDLKNPLICEILIGKQLLEWHDTRGYLSYDRYRYCIENTIDKLEWTYEEKDDKVEFGYDGWDW